MAKIGEFKELFKCGFCEKILEDPVFLPCGESICNKHSDVFANDCLFCYQEHSVPEKGFASNKMVQKMLKLEVDRISLKSVSYDQCKKTMDDIAFLNSQVDSILRDPKNLIYEQFSDLKNIVDLKKEKLTADLNDWYDRIIEEINQAQSRCEEESSNNLTLIQSLSKDVSKEDYTKLVKRFENFEIGIYYDIFCI